MTQQEKESPEWCILVLLLIWALLLLLSVLGHVTKLVAEKGCM